MASVETSGLGAEERELLVGEAAKQLGPTRPTQHCDDDCVLQPWDGG